MLSLRNPNRKKRSRFFDDLTFPTEKINEFSLYRIIRGYVARNEAKVSGASDTIANEAYKKASKLEFKNLFPEFEDYDLAVVLSSYLEMRTALLMSKKRKNKPCLFTDAEIKAAYNKYVAIKNLTKLRDSIVEMLP